MFTPILATKLFVPPTRPGAIRRRRLIERLNEGLQRRLTLISALAGSGKTALVSQWGAGCDRPVAWLSLDDGDSDPIRFLTYFVAAIQTIEPKIGAEALSVLQSPQPPPTEAILTALLNEINAVAGEFILVLDDYHTIESAATDDALAFLLEHLPLQMHLVIATREDPQLPLARYRARGHLTELRAADLRFTPPEAAEFLTEAMGLRLSAEDITALETRTEGWVAGLQLAALSMQGRQDTAAFIRAFSGSHHFVLDYLLQEVLHKQPERVQHFLLSTSLFDRLCGPLCDAVLLDAAASGQETLEYLEHANLFIIPLDNERRWYRYHHLFAELLRSQLGRRYPDQIIELHRRASDWYARNQAPSEGIIHALAIPDWSRAADIIERFSDELPMRGEISTLLGWLESFPQQVLLDRVRLGLVYAWTLFMANQLDGAEAHLAQLLPVAQSTPSFLGELLSVRLMIAANRYDLPAVLELAEQALSLVPPEQASPRSRILLSLGVACDELGGDITVAKRAFAEAFELGMAVGPSNSVGNAPLPVTALAYLSEIEWRQGNLRAAARTYEQALRLAEQWGATPSIALCFVQWGRGSLLYEWNDLDGAAAALHESMRIGELWNNPRLLVPAYGLSAMVMQAQGKPDAAREMVRRAEHSTRAVQSPPPTLGSLALYQIMLWTAQDDWQAITRWEQQHDVEWQSRTGRARETLAYTLASACMARFYRRREGGALRQARALLDPALARAQADGLVFNTTRLLILDALAQYALGKTASALAALQRALAMAEPEHYVRSFLDIGAPMQDLLTWSLETQSWSDPHLRSYAGELLSGFSSEPPVKARQPTGAALSEPLTAREMEVLRLIAKGLSNREISERLFLALSTVKGHTRIIFDKLQVQRRTEAVARARELGLL